MTGFKDFRTILITSLSAVALASCGGGDAPVSPGEGSFGGGSGGGTGGGGGGGGGA